MDEKLGKRKLYKLACDLLKYIDFPECKSCNYYYCSCGHNEVLSFSNIIITRNIYSHIFIVQYFKEV